MNLCSIASGSSGNCIYVGSDKTSVLVDAGISGKRIEQGLNSIERTTKDCDAILITHEHSDHVKGLGVLARKYRRDSIVRFWQKKHFQLEIYPFCHLKFHMMRQNR